MMDYQGKTREKLVERIIYLEKSKTAEIAARCKIDSELAESKTKISMGENALRATQETLDKQVSAFKKRTAELVTIQRVIRGRSSSESKINVVQDLFDSMKNPFE